MVSPMASTCDPYATKCTKAEPKILQVKRGQKWRNAPDSARKRRNRVRSGCWREVQRVRTDGKTGIDRHRTCLGCRLGRLVACVPPARTRPTTRTAQGAAVPGCQDIPPTNEKWRGKHMLTSPFLAGAEGLEPSARGFGVDVETPQRERGRGGVGRFLSQVTKRPVLVWCCGKFRGTKRPKINQAQYDRNSAGVMIAGCVTPDSRKSLSPVRSTSALAWMAARRMGRSFTSRI